MENKRVLTVTQLNMYVKSLLESNQNLADIYISGEISNFTNHYKSGHLYMSIKDETGVIKAVMFRQYASKLQFVPKDGMKIIVRGRVSLYERDGTYQLYIVAMKQAGLGELQLKYEQLKEKLSKEGLFSPEFKKPLPSIPSKVAVITSPTGAAVQDILNILKRRFPSVTVVMCPVQVQGELAAPQLIEAVNEVNRKKCADVIIIGRGGGSIEDLWAFNDETLARTIFASEIPVISAVGHETDFTICDYVADKRAPTPSAAAELAVPDRLELQIRIDRYKVNLNTALKRNYQQNSLKLQSLMNKQCMKNPLFYITLKGQTVDLLENRLNKAFEKIYSKNNADFLKIASKLNSLSPTNVLLRGYSVVYKDNKIISSKTDLQKGDRVEINFSDGTRTAEISE
ncbi:MAG: exodeoxyribonuclease VII large subunit [Acutalibacteraceae bacterium]|nr:exodeoxyribonuclease VII large subunit [Acutalibacteraceae bacterium]